ncbi:MULTISPECIES: DeoR/GlpR family DNA-binding transcription regulator [unclassified Novosphingobium]|uniref:DeoR/GlpR family DNA-binding transcription regulator n=1 Tax=unclassified Novosphingobium TaxID=2644732 RepID=UPI00146B606A|nr:MULTISPECIES: DeoR/GlpR family DNA-binding transcription regulator [unclassified Novosphingobium]NMN06643.1 DeoR family glycerol-3-phosphate regulon repressor [Novosphingobium sp. SG919]NMN88906.1 DeoR family glycerol-3-phosphate regulon repressor [Novosphingobium sp. SG916]
MSIKRQDRQDRLLALLGSGTTLAIAALARDLDVSDETIRRELRDLEAAGRVERLHGAVRLARRETEGPLDRRLHENVDAKKRIAQAAARFVADGDIIFIDAGTTTFHIAQALRQHTDLTVITNSLGVATALGGINGNRLFLAGGQMDYEYRAFSDRQAQDYVAGFTPHLALLSVGAVSADRGLMDFHAGEATMSRIAYATAGRVLLAADASKFGRYGLMATAPCASVSVLVTDQPLAPDIASVFAHAEVVVTG